MKIIDIHTHIYPEDIARKATKSVQDFYQIGDGAMDGTEQLLMERGKAAGISQFLILPVAIRPDRVQGINDFIVQRLAQNPNLIGFGTVHAAMDGITDEVQRIMDLGLKGIKMHPDSQRFAIDDLRLFPVYEQAQGKLPIMLHMGDHRYDYSHPIKLQRILHLFPRLQVIAAHFGGYSMYETACELLKETDCVFDISSSMMFMPEGEAERYINIYGAERMAFGTDYPMWDPVQEVRHFLDLKLTPEQKEQIAHKTAQRILHL
ncbi:MAG: amidohydrolase family protein [Oscillospiraceae bacterium]|nr:amidohydrolase family protein [Oscillospiraceae bacterium]